MNGVLGVAELLLARRSTTDQRRRGTSGRRVGTRSSRVINDILDFSKIEAEQLEIESVEFDLHDMVETTVKLTASSMGESDVEMVTDISAETPVHVMGDPTRLRQVPSEPPRQRDQVHAQGRDRHDRENGIVGRWPRRFPGARQRHRNVRRDPRGDLRAVPSGRRSTTRRYGGTGLGLAICHQLVAAMGGRIGVHSETDEGSRFWFTVEFAVGSGISELSVPAAPPTASSRASQARGRVLVVEDNEINQLVALGLLEALGYEAVAVDNGAEAVTLAGDGDFDAVLMDIQMPGMDGYVTAQRIRGAESPPRRTPIIAMTASAMQGERERCLAAGMDDYLSKPVASHRLEAVLAHYLGTPAAATISIDTEQRVPAAPDQHDLDVTRLEELDALGEGAAALVTRAITNFIRNAPATLAELESAHRRGEVEEVAALAHRLKGSAWNLGALRVGSLCERLEHEARSSDLVDVDRQLAEVRSAYDDAARALRSYRQLEDAPVAARG